MRRLPDHTFAGYAELLDRLRAVGIQYPYIRHDVDIHLSPFFVRLAQMERERGLTSQWFIRDDAPGYNPFASDSVYLLRTLAELGGSFGYHYPIDGTPGTVIIKRMDNLAWRTGLPFTAYVGHRPSAAEHKDWMRGSLLNPHTWMAGVPYVSDSRREWRTDVPHRLDQILEHGTEDGRLHINLHPEWWLTHDTVGNRNRYLESRMRLNMERHVRAIIAEERDSWVPQVAA